MQPNPKFLVTNNETQTTLVFHERLTSRFLLQEEFEDTKG